MPLDNDASDIAFNSVPTDFSKIRVGIKTLDDAVVNLGNYQKINKRCGNKTNVLKAINDGDLGSMREISEFFYKTSGIYARLCRYMAYLYRYDWFVVPYINGGNGVAANSDTALTSSGKNKILENFFKALKYLDDFKLKRFFGEVALKVIKEGCYYGYLITENNKITVQELPPAYCRSRFSVNNRPAVEFNMAFFDDYFTDADQRVRVLKLFPEDFRKGYKAYKMGKLKGDFAGDSAGWYLLEFGKVVKFNLNGEDFPPFIAVIPSIIDLDAAQDLDRKRVAQKLLKIIIQKMPIDKNGDLVFDVDEAQALHNNAVNMLKRAIGIDVLTTFADVDVADMSDRSNTTQTDDLQRVERTVYNEAGVSQMQFNSESSAAVANSILNDEANLLNLIQQFEDFINILLEPYNKNPKKCYYKAEILTTTTYNYKQMAKLYKEQTQMGYSKMLPQIALGQSQSSILASAYWENDVLNLVEVFVPPMSSATMNADTLRELTSGNGIDKTRESDQKGAGRPELADDQKSEKTVQNRESM